MNRVYHKPEIVTDTDGRTYLTRASWNHDTMSIHIMENGLLEWIKVDELARLVWGRNTDNFRRAVKRRLPGLKRHLALAYNRLLVVEYEGGRGSASALKIYDPEAPGDVQAMHRMMADMAARKDGMLKYYEKVTGLTGVSWEEQS